MNSTDTVNDTKKNTIIIKAIDDDFEEGKVINADAGSDNYDIGKDSKKTDMSRLLADAALCLKNGGLVAFPTETVYGLGADGLNPEASKKIYAAKGRPSDNPLIVHIADLDALEELAYTNEKAYTLAHAFWPGPLTIILPKKDIVPKETTGGLDTVAVRMPSHPAAQSLIRQSGVYVAAPSANISGRPSPTKAEHVIEDMQGRIDYIIEGGAVGIGIESTIVDLTGEVPIILRPGYITKKMLEEMIGEVAMDPALERPVEMEAKGVHPKAPGMKYTHYAPKGELTLVEADVEEGNIPSIDVKEVSDKNGQPGLELVLDKKEGSDRKEAEEKNSQSYLEMASDKKEGSDRKEAEEKNKQPDLKRTSERKQELDRKAPEEKDSKPVNSIDAVVEKIRQLAVEKQEQGFKVGIMAPKETLSLYEGYADVVVCVGDRSRQATVAAGLYAALREFDEQGAQYIYAESFRGDGISYAIMNRLLKAAGHRIIKV